MRYKPDVVQKPKFEYSPLGQVFHKGLDGSDKKEGLLKRLKNIENKNEQQLEAIRDQGETQLNLVNKSRVGKLEIKSVPGSKAQQLRDVINEIVEEYEDKYFSTTHSNGTESDFYKFTNVNRLENKLLVVRYQ